METCLKAAFSKPKSGAVRVSIMNRESAWKMLDKPLRAHLVIAAHEEEPPATDDEDDASDGHGDSFSDGISLSCAPSCDSTCMVSSRPAFSVYAV